jgi:hypothetical protein
VRCTSSSSSAAGPPAPWSSTSYDGRTIPFDLLVTVPLNMGADFVARSGLGDDLNYVPDDPQTFLARGHDDIPT